MKGLSILRISKETFTVCFPTALECLFGFFHPHFNGLALGRLRMFNDGFGCFSFGCTQPVLQGVPHVLQNELDSVPVMCLPDIEAHGAEGCLTGVKLGIAPQ